jgi:NADPH2:quinone reductase
MMEAAALPLVSITAWEALFKKAKLTNKNNILIHGGKGGVGHVAVQLAKWCGANVSATVRKNEDFSLVKSFGANEVINATEEDVEKYVSRLTNNQGFDIVFDTVGGPNLDKSLLATKINGSVVTTLARSTHDLTPLQNKALGLYAVNMLLPLLSNQDRETHGEILLKIAKIVDEGKLKPLIDSHQFTLATVKDAHALLESGKAQGKIVISIA